MFSSSLFTAETPAPSQIKAGSTPVGTELPAEGEQTVEEQAAGFAKELQSVVNEEQNGKTSQQTGAEAIGSQATVSVITEPGEEDAANLLIDNTESDAGSHLGKVESNIGKVKKQQDGQRSASEKFEEPAELDPAAKQQIMSNGEELLSRLSESNKQLAVPAEQSAGAAEDVPEGKKLPPEHVTGARSALAAELPAATQTLEAAEPLQAGARQVQSAPVTPEQTVSDTSDDGAAVTEQVVIGQPAITADATLAVDAQPVGISPQELARVFAAPEAQPTGAQEQVPLEEGGQADMAVMAPSMADEGNEVDAAVMARALAAEGEQPDAMVMEQASTGDVSPILAEMAAKTSAEGQGSRPVSVQPGELLQKSATSKAAEQTIAQRMPADLVSADLASTERADEGKVKAGGALTPAALAAPAHHGSSQPLATEAGPVWAATVGNPSLSSYVGGAADMPEMQAATAGSTAGGIDAQPDGTAGIAAGTAAMAAALEHGAAGSSEAKAAESVHSLSPGLATQQGQAIAQARSEAAQAQSPLQLSKEQAGDELAERMQMMMSKNLKHVDIRLDPPELGKLQIKLSLNQDQASVQFTVANQQTRDLVEQAMPRLRELLSQQGLQLAQSSVQQDSPRQQFAGQPNQQQQGQQGGSGGQHNSGSSHGQDSRGVNAEAVDMYVSQPTDRVDYYA